MHVRCCKQVVYMGVGFIFLPRIGVMSYSFSLSYGDLTQEKTLKLW